MSAEAKPVTGQTDSCRVCGKAIEYEGRFWTHVGSPQPRHPATPMSVSGGEMSILSDDEGTRGG